MARKLQYNHIRFDGGMTDSPRDTSDLTKLSMIRHMDIYRDSSRMYVMPGYVNDMSIGGDADGMKQYDIRAIANLSARVVAVGTKADGTGSKLFNKADPTTAEWGQGVFGTSTEGTDDLAGFTYLGGNDGEAGTIYYVTEAGTATYISKVESNTVTDKHRTISGVGAGSTTPMTAEQHYTGEMYATETPSTGLTLLGSDATLDAKPTGIFLRDVHSGGELLGLIGATSGSRRSRLLLWDSESLLADQNVDFGFGLPIALGKPAGIWTAVINEGLGTDNSLLSEANNLPSMAVKVLNGENNEVLYRYFGESSSNAVALPTRSHYRDSMLWYARIATNTAADEFTEGVWACGKGDIRSPLAVSMPFDTSSLGVCKVVKGIGNHFFFVHGGDGSISRLDSFATGTYDVPATIETLIYGANSPYQKELNGISIVTEDLPAGGSVVCKYRVDEDSAWTTMGTSNTVGSRRHSFTKAEGAVIGKFQEIQFQLVIAGRVTIKNISIVLTETDNLPY